MVRVAKSNIDAYTRSEQPVDPIKGVAWLRNIRELDGWASVGSGDSGDWPQQLHPNKSK